MAEILKGTRKEQAEITAALAALRINISRQREAEVKTKVSWAHHQRVRKELEEMEAPKVFEGDTNTWLFAGPHKGVSVRINESVPDDKKISREFRWTIKFDSQKEMPGRVLKNKDEIEGAASLFRSSKEQLRAVLDTLHMPVDLDAHQLMVGKRRVSYIVPKSEEEKRKNKYKPLQIDLDTFVSVDGKKIVPRYVIEKEDTSDLSEAVKRKRIDSLAERFKLTISPEYAALSTKGFLIKEGIIKEQYVLEESALMKEIDVA